MITTTFLEKAQDQINALVGKAAQAEHQTNLDHINDIHAQIKKLKEHLDIIHDAAYTHE